jgi:hypothetical protein
MDNEKNREPVNPANAILAFGAWLTTRPEVTTAGSHENAAPMAERVAEFNKNMGWQVDESQILDLNHFPATVPLD